MRVLRGGSAGEESAYNAGDLGSIPGSGRSLEKGMATHSSVLPGQSLDRGAWRATVHGVPESQTRLSDTHISLGEDFKTSVSL